MEQRFALFTSGRDKIDLFENCKDLKYVPISEIPVDATQLSKTIVTGVTDLKQIERLSNLDGVELDTKAIDVIYPSKNNLKRFLTGPGFVKLRNFNEPLSERFFHG